MDEAGLLGEGVSERALKRVSARISLFRNLSILVAAFALCVLFVVLVLPELLPRLVKVWLVSISGAAFLVLIVALILARNDSTATLLFSKLVDVTSGVVIGVAIGSLYHVFASASHSA